MAATAPHRSDLEVPPAVGGHSPPVDTAIDLVDRIARLIDEAADAVGLTVPQAMLLRHLDEPTRMGELAENRMCDRSSITHLVDRLEAAELIVRTPDPDDQRARLVTLTPTGRQARTRFMERLSTRTTGLGGLSESDVQALRRACRRLG